MRRVIIAFDHFLSNIYGVTPFTDDPECVLRIRLHHAAHAIYLPDVEVAKGAPILELHFWNDHIPPMPKAGPDPAWSIRFWQRIMSSTRSLARLAAQDAQLANAQAIGGASVLFASTEGAATNRLARRVGFTVFPYHNPLGRFGLFWENFYTWWLMWAYNAASVRHRRLLHVQRSEVWMSMPEFLRRYGK
jgi:hypothetical protein